MNGMKTLTGLMFFLIASGPSYGQTTDQQDDAFLNPYRQAASERWEKEIQKLEVLNESETHPDDAILFLGSSSIRRSSNNLRSSSSRRSSKKT